MDVMDKRLAAAVELILEARGIEPATAAGLIAAIDVLDEIEARTADITMHVHILTPHKPRRL